MNIFKQNISNGPKKVKDSTKTITPWYSRYAFKGGSAEKIQTKCDQIRLNTHIYKYNVQKNKQNNQSINK